MAHDVEVREVSPMLLAAVRREVAPGQVATTWRPALDLVWRSIRAQDGLWSGGHNVFLYHHPGDRDPMVVDFGVQVTRAFDADGEVRPVQTPAGRAAVTLHVGPPDGLRAAHAAIERWCAEHGETLGDQSWETYGDWGDDPATYETWVSYLLQRSEPG